MVQSVEGTVEIGGPCTDDSQCKPDGCGYGPDITFCTTESATPGVCACPQHFRDDLGDGPDGGA